MNEKDENNHDGSQETKNTDQQPVSGPRKNRVFLMRAEGQSFEEFKEFCIKKFREAGLIKEKT